jgi:hypothetical protein
MFVLFSWALGGFWGAPDRFCGMAEMKSPIDNTRSFDAWAESDKYSGCFVVKWHFIKVSHYHYPALSPALHLSLFFGVFFILLFSQLL